MIYIFRSSSTGHDFKTHFRKNKSIIPVSHVSLFIEFKEGRADKRELTSLYHSQTRHYTLFCLLQRWSGLSLFLLLLLLLFLLFFSPFFSFQQIHTRPFVSRHKPGCALGSACMGCLMSKEAVGRRATKAAISAASEACSGTASRSGSRVA